MCVNVQTGFGARHIDRFSRSISMRLYSVQCLLLDRLILLEAGSRALVGLQAPGSLPSISSLTFRASMSIISIMAIRVITAITAIRAIMDRGYQAIMAIKADQTKLTGLTGMKV